MTRCPPILLGLCVLVACAAPGDTPVHADDPLDVFAVGVAAWNAGDLPGYLATYAPDAVYVSGAKVLRGLPAIAASYEARFGDAEAMGRLSLDDVRLEWRDGARAFAVGHFLLERDGQPDARGTFSVGLARLGERWAITSDHSASE